MIDKNGKLFGKINIIDLVVIIILVAAVAVVGVSKFRSDNISSSVKTLVVSYYAEEIKDAAAQKIAVGDSVFDEACSKDLGIVCAEPEISESISYIVNTDNEYIRSARPGYSSIIIQAELTVELTDYGFVIDDMTYGVGHTLSLLAGDTRFSARVYDIKIKE